MQLSRVCSCGLGLYVGPGLKKGHSGRGRACSVPTCVLEATQHPDCGEAVKRMIFWCHDRLGWCRECEGCCTYIQSCSGKNATSPACTAACIATSPGQCGTVSCFMDRRSARRVLCTIFNILWARLQAKLGYLAPSTLPTEHRRVAHHGTRPQAHPQGLPRRCAIGVPVQRACVWQACLTRPGQTSELTSTHNVLQPARNSGNDGSLPALHTLPVSSSYNDTQSLIVPEAHHANYLPVQCGSGVHQKLGH